MNFPSFRSLSAGLLAAVISLSCLPSPARAETVPTDPSGMAVCTEPSSAETVLPEETRSEPPQPTKDQPEQPLPGESVPAGTQLEETLSTEPLPTETLPAETQPTESLPSEALPEEIPPIESLPSESLPEDPPPAESLPPETLPEEPSSTEPVPTQPEAPSPLLLTLPAPEPAGPGIYFGQLGAYSDISETLQPVQDLFAAAQAAGMDFLAVTDHSDSFDRHALGQIDADAIPVSTDWAAGKAAALAATGPSFVGIYGYEMNWPYALQVGHISTFNTPGFQSWDQEAFKKYRNALPNYYDALAAVPSSISRFNHPGTQFGNFSDFGHYSETTDRLISLIEVDCSDKFSRQQYTKALDLGWHLAPTAISGSETARTAIHAQSLTEEGLYDALRSCRAYATEDADLSIAYTMNGHPMGSRLKKRHISDAIEISVALSDPTDDAVGTVEVVTDGGLTAAVQTLSTSSGTLSIYLPAVSGYYYLRITQPDGDMALTAPIWLDAEEQLGISDLRCETAVPVQNEPTALVLDLYNGETVDFSVSGLEILADGLVIASLTDLTVLPASTSLSHPISFRTDCVGLTEITVHLNGTLEGSPRSFSQTLHLNFRRAEQVTSILADGSHGNAGTDQLEMLKRMATDEHIRLTVVDTGLSVDALKDCRFLLVTAPSQPFSENFLKTAAEFAGFGGSILICGQGDSADPDFDSAEQLNRLLAAIGSSMAIRDDLVRDTVNNTGTAHIFHTDGIRLSSPWCSGISENQVFRVDCACSIDPGSADVLISGRSTADSIDGDSDGLGENAAGTIALLACEPLSGGGTVFACGSLFLHDDNMEEPRNIWDEPLANRTFAQTLLGIGGEVLPLSSIAEARSVPPGTLVRVRGYATTGTSNPHNTFPGALYLQDDTGAIAVMPFTGASIQQGTPLEITGHTGIRNGNRTLRLSSWKVLDGFLYQYPPLQGDWDLLLDPAENGNRLVQVEGVCCEIYCREDDTLAGCLLMDDRGRTARILIEDDIRNGSDGENELHKKIRKARTVRAAGILHLDAFGEPVIRVRNCEEVVWVPLRHYWNPKTGDFLPEIALPAMAMSLTGLLLLKKRRKP